MTVDNQTFKVTVEVLEGDIIDIRRRKIEQTFHDQLPAAFKGEKDFPKEIAYTSGMQYWNAIANRSYQTTDELTIIENTADEVVSKLPDKFVIIDLGAANSKKFAPYVRAALKQGKSVTYLPLDLQKDSIIAQVARARDLFPRTELDGDNTPAVKVIGLWGTFADGYDWFKNIPPARLFLSLGSIFFNGPEEVSRFRCQEFSRDLHHGERLIVGQDSPVTSDSSKVHGAYDTPQYHSFLTQYLKGVQELAGIDADVASAWKYESVLEKSMHYFAVTAQQDMICKNFDNYRVSANTTYKMFKSWKLSTDDIHQLAQSEGLAIATLGELPGSGMKQYILSKK